MIRRWWNSLGFYWQVYIAMVLCFGGIITFVEGIVEPCAEDALLVWLPSDPFWREVLFWVISVVVPTLLLGYMVTRMVMNRLSNTVAMARRLSQGDLTARATINSDGRDVFNHLSRAFNDMADNLERLLANEKRLLADISHELRSPLTRMGVAAALLPKKRDAADFEPTVRALENEIEQMNELVGILLEQGRERLKAPEGVERVDLSRLAAEAAESFGMVADSAGKRIETAIESGVTITANPLRVRMIFENVISNALFYTPEGTAVNVTLRTNGDNAEAVVRDFGPGVPDKYLQDIFRAFFRVDKSRARNSGGAGLGLALAHDAVVALGGDVKAANAGPGLEVFITVPLRGHAE